jgi:hypothetical protein
VISSHFNFHLLSAAIFATGLCCPVMTETAHQKRGGKPFHSILEPHYDFIRELRQRRKTWQEIADLLLSEKGIGVTFHAPYLFYRRRLKRATKPNWENSITDSQPAHPDTAASRPQPRLGPLPPSPRFQRPDRSKFNTDEFT